ncbi:hypothetical protein SAMN04488518_108254 [Pseudovibrio ascidiaceicola]|uniref:Uncharacterized protein n=1 Tax=Pseudovibrio ascidiaceicola TaxID=285279 RepID=A0A1I4C1D0_9HYPH|nr:hypothetical protein [Pseudovibrio ascidiaceicola]SFK73996.1 hypothetical protein SAMN04488518_108254 [Pseudovibrio ascidiaceicola]
MRLTKLKRSGVALILTLGMLGPANSQITHRDNRGNPFTDLKRLSASRQISVQNLTVLTDAVGVEFCKERYGNGYNVYPAPNGRRGQFVSDKGHKFSLYARSELRGDGIYAEHSQVLITFPNDPDVEVETTQFITGFVNSKMFSGVFSDGVCSGKFSVVNAK